MAAESESAVTKLCSEIKELCEEIQFLQDQQSENQASSSKEQQEDATPLPSIFSIDFEDVTTRTGVSKIPNG